MLVSYFLLSIIITCNCVVLILFSDKLNHLYCRTIESALMAGIHDIRLIGISTNNDANSRDNKFKKMFALLDELKENHEDNDIVIFADAYDVLFQKNIDTYASDYVIFNGENKCWPFVHPHPSIYNCPLMQGDYYLDTKKTPLACKMSAEKAEKLDVHHGSSIFLNSGLSIGKVGVYKSILEAAISLVPTLPPLCHDDQGILAWLYLKDIDYKIRIDYEQKLLISANRIHRSFIFWTDKGLWSFNGTFPIGIHFNGDKSHYHKFFENLKASSMFDKNITYARNVSVYGNQIKFEDFCPV